MNKTFYVQMPIAGILGISVEAENEAEAIEKAMQDCKSDDIDEWDVYETIVQGNVLYAPLNEIIVEEE